MYRLRNKTARVQMTSSFKITLSHLLKRRWNINPMSVNYFEEIVGHPVGVVAELCSPLWHGGHIPVSGQQF
jgi:hypothetical protein